MGRKLSIAFLLISLAIFTGALGVLLVKDNTSRTTDNSNLTDFTINEQDEDYKERGNFRNQVSFKETDTGYYVIDRTGIKDIYDLGYQAAIYDKILQMTSLTSYTMGKPLMILNPYGTNVTGLYVYFETDAPTTIEYTIYVGKKSIPDYTNTLATRNDNPVVSHEGQLIGLVQGEKNKITLRAYDKTGKVVNKQSFVLDIPDFNTIKETALNMEISGDITSLSEGLFVLFGYDRRNKKEQRHLLFYDNYGVIRAEIPLNVVYSDVKLEYIKGNLFYAFDDKSYFMVSPLGRVLKHYTIKGYTSHHDFEYDGDNTVLILANNNAKKTEEDIILSLSLDSGEVKELIDFEMLMPDICERATLPKGEKLLDWIHFNTISLVNGKDILLSSRELSSIIHVKDIYTNPTIAYILADKKIWEGTDYEALVFNKNGKFLSNTGQHTVTYVPDRSLEEGQYYIDLFNNNYGVSKTWKFDWSKLGKIGLPDKDADHSMYYRYLVDEQNRTFRLVKSFDVPYSSIVSSVQEFKGHVIVNSGMSKVFGEYNEAGKPIVQYKMKVNLLTYRVIKHDMKGIWF